MFKKRKTLYGYLPPKNITELKPWDLVHVDLIVLYINSIRKQKPGRTVIRNNASLTYMTMIDPATGWFEIVEILTFDLDEVTIGNDKYIDKSSSRVSQLFNNTWICRYPHPSKSVFDNGCEFKRDFAPFLKDFNIKPVLTSVKNPQANAPVDQVHQVIVNMLVIKYIDNKFFDYIYPWGETLVSISWAIRASYHHTIITTPSQDFFVRDVLFNLASVVYWLVATAAKQCQVDIDNVT